jgi:hypothetical protein
MRMGGGGEVRESVGRVRVGICQAVYAWCGAHGVSRISPGRDSYSCLHLFTDECWSVCAGKVEMYCA